MWELGYKKAEHWRIDAFEPWCWRRLPWTARTSNQSILRKISPEYSLEGLMLKLKFEELTHLKRPWCWERLKAGGEGDDRGWDGWMASLTQWTWVWVNTRSWWWTGRPGLLQSMGSQRVRHDWATELRNQRVVREDFTAPRSGSVKWVVQWMREGKCFTLDRQGLHPSFWESSGTHGTGWSTLKYWSRVKFP